MKIIFLISTLILFNFTNVFADNTYFIDFTKVLNTSKAGASAQDKLQSQFKSESKKYNTQQKAIKKEESQLITQKKQVSSEDYQKKVKKLREKVSDFQKNKQKSFNSLAAARRNSKKKLLEKVNPIIEKYMVDNNIRIIIDKKSVILGDRELEITNKIIAILDQKIPSIK